MHPIRCIRRASILGLVLGPVVAGCLSRPVTNSTPDTQTIFSTSIDKSAVKRVDLLFMIDNSKSMGDKQAYLSAAVPDLLTRLVTPNCLDPSDPTKVLGVSSNGACATGRIEFPPVHDMHIAVVSSSLGSLGGDVCTEATSGPIPNGQNDDGQLINRAAGVTDAPEGFLAWLPPTSDNDGVTPTPGTPPVTDAATLIQDFQQIVTAVGEGGCGIEAQLESWYRFLVQPDPYQSISTAGGSAALVGVDATVLKQRHDFLRPDSLLAIIDLSDEDDSSVDVRAYNGSNVAGFHMNEQGTAPYRGTSECATDPTSSACTSCDASGVSDPVCTATPHYDPSTTPQGEPNIRHIQMKQQFGLDSQYPMSRYVTGLTATMVPDRTGEYPDGAQTYAGNADCVNPIFAQDLPDGSDLDPATLCNLTPGPRTPDLVYYAHIGGVPSKLLHYDPTNPSSTQLSDADWKAILGNDPSTFDTSGIDPSMLETYEQRPLYSAPGSTYWDLAYACTFALNPVRDCTQVGAAQGCDCAESTPPPGTSGWELCDPNNPTIQIAAKAYPTVRELTLAKLMGAQGVVSSLCPIDAKEAAPGDPLYGYRPAMAAILQRLASSLVGACLPHELTVTDGAVDCLVLASLPGTGQTCDPAKGLAPADPQTVAHAAQSLQGQATAALLDTTQRTVCQMSQLPAPDGGSCTTSADAGWCYVVGAAAGNTCGNAIQFSPAAQPSTGVETLLSCIETTPTVTN
jgi:hypothetical protein